MNHEEKYKQALERASKLRVQNPFDTVGQMVEHIFPELKESEDESIKKDLMGWFEEFPDMIWRGHYKKDVLAWLEKQGNILDADKVIEWVKNTFPTPDMLIDKFKKDFSL